MPRYHLNLFNDIDVFDEEGFELPDLAAAKDKAIGGARSLMAEHIRLGRPVHLNHRIEIADDHGKTLAVIPFREMITVLDGGSEPD